MTLKSAHCRKTVVNSRNKKILIDAHNLVTKILISLCMRMGYSFSSRFIHLFDYQFNHNLQFNNNKSLKRLRVENTRRTFVPSAVRLFTIFINGGETDHSPGQQERRIRDRQDSGGRYGSREGMNRKRR